MGEIVLETHGLTKTYGSFTAVNGIDLTINRREILGFLGPNGAGKSTTINMICGVTVPTSGKITYNGAGFSRNIVSSLIGVAPQDTILYDQLTCLEQLVFIGEMQDMTSKDAKQSAEQLLDLVGLIDVKDRLAKNLSGGMKRRLNIVMALIHDPPVVILDEPVVGLDPQSRILIRDLIRDMAQKKTIILTTHNMYEAELLSDRVAIIDHGTILAVDTPDNLKNLVELEDVIEVVFESSSEDLSGYKVVGNTLFIPSRDAARELSSVIKDLQSKGITPLEVRFRKTSLEDVFIKFTGRMLRE